MSEGVDELVAAPPRAGATSRPPSGNPVEAWPAVVARPRHRLDGFSLAALAIVLVGVALRLYTILVFPWDQDEIYTIVESRDLFHTTLPPGINARPLYYLLQHPLLELLPRTPAMLRMLPLIFGAAGLWVTWLAGRRHVGRVGGLVAVFLASTSTWHMEVSGQARYYSLIYLCTALVLLWLPEAYDSQRPAPLFWTFAAMAVGTLTHPSFVFPVVGLVLGASLVTREGRARMPWPTASEWRWLWTPFIALLVVFFAALRFAHRQSAIRNSIGRGDAASVRLLPAIVEWMTPVVFGAAVIAALYLLMSRRPGMRRLGAITLFTSIVTCVALFAASYWTDIYATYATGLLPVMFVAAGALAQLVADDRRLAGDARVASGAIALLACAVAPSLASHLSDGTRFDYRPAYAQIQREAPTRPVVAWPDALAETYAPTLTLLPYHPRRAYLDSLLVQHGEFWFVASIKRAGIALDDNGDVARWLDERCRRRGAYERPRFDYRIYRVELHRCTAPREQAAAAPR